MKTSVIGQTIVLLEQVGSTNNYATSQVRENEVKEGTVFLAVSQTQGRGQQTNSWESADGKNLTLSIVLKPYFLEIKDQFMLSKAVCLGIEAFLSRFVAGVTIKWPNDIYVNDRKICGILIENAIMGGRFSSSVIGIGLNINQAAFYSNAPNPVSLTQLTGQTYDLDELLNNLLENIDEQYVRLQSGDAAGINREFAGKLFWLDEWHYFKDEECRYKGRILGVNEIGQLRVENEAGTIKEYHFKEVEYQL